MSRALPKYNKRRVGIIGGAAAVVLSGAVIAGSALAGEGANNEDAAGNASPGTITCPAVEGSLPAIPASAKAEVDSNLAQLQTQIQEANQRLIDTVGRAVIPDLLKVILSPTAASTAGPALSSMLIYLLMAIVLVVRPSGLFPAPGSR